MNENLQAAVDALQAEFGASLQTFRGEHTLILAREQIAAAAQALRDRFQFEMLVDVTAVDYWPQEEPRFHVIYQFNSVSHHGLLRVRVPLSAAEPKVPTLEGVYPGANWYEREVWDMFGIHIEGHSDLRRIIMPHDWVGHPLRKDYPLGYEEVQFTFNFDDISLRKPHPKE